jgi:hypothetical protein
MSIPIADLVIKLDRRVYRLSRWLELKSKVGDTRGLRQLYECMLRDIRLCHIAAIAVRARARKVVRLAASLGIQYEVKDVRRNPFAIAYVLAQHVLGAKYEGN